MAIRASRCCAWLALAALVSACGGDSTAPPGGGTAVLTSILLSAPAGTINVGSSSQLTASPQDQNGSPFNAAVTWSSSSSAVATVSQTGRVTGISVGVATISAASGTVRSAPLLITVISVGGTYPLSAEVDMPGFIFSPTFTDIARTGTVRFVFPSISHNVLFTAGVAGTPANIDILANTTVSRTFNTAGSFSYVCTVHPGMQGTIIVH